MFASVRRYQEAGFTRSVGGRGFRRHIITIGQEWEYWRGYESRPLTTRLSYEQAWVKAFLLSGHFDASGEDLYELSIPPVAVPYDLLDVYPFAVQTALLFVADIPIAQNGVSGRHVHISPAVRRQSGVRRALSCAAPFFAALAQQHGSSIAFVFRESVTRYSVVHDSVGDSHYDAVNVNPADSMKPVTLEIRHAETPPLVAGIGAWILYRLLSGAEFQACSQVQMHSGALFTAPPGFFAAIAKEICRDEYCREVVETYGSIVEQGYRQSWRAVRPMYPFFEHAVARLLDVIAEMRNDKVRRTDDGYSCYRCDGIYLDAPDEMRYEQFLRMWLWIA